MPHGCAAVRAGVLPALPGNGQQPDQQQVHLRPPRTLSLRRQGLELAQHKLHAGDPQRDSGVQPAEQPDPGLCAKHGAVHHEQVLEQHRDAGAHPKLILRDLCGGRHNDRAGQSDHAGLGSGQA